LMAFHAAVLPWSAGPSATGGKEDCADAAIFSGAGAGLEGAKVGLVAAAGFVAEARAALGSGGLLLSGAGMGCTFGGS